MRREVLREPTIFLVHDFLSHGECADHVARAEALGFEEADLRGSGEVFPEIRNNDRVIHEDAALAASLYERARQFLVPEWMGRAPTGFNELWRYYRYVPGQRFKLHGDGAHSRPSGEESQFTFLVYLNDDVEGGSTNFHFARSEVLKVKPRAGTALVFMHKHLHEGAEVLAGTKYVLRTDVMYSPLTPQSPLPASALVAPAGAPRKGGEGS